VPSTLLQRIAAGDPDAVRECVARYSALVWSLVRRLCGPGPDAEDAAQEIFISLWRSAGTYDPALASEPTFVAMIARRRLIDRARARQRRPDAGPLVEIADLPRLSPIEASDESARAASALLALSQEQQRVIRLAVHEGLSHEQIAAATGMPLGTVKTNIRRGLLRVRELLSSARAAKEVAT
jgi:RNA polymerase sigma-70 factor (ECF subfamily)